MTSYRYAITPRSFWILRICSRHFLFCLKTFCEQIRARDTFRYVLPRYLRHRFRFRFYQQFFLSLLSLSFPLPFTPTVSSKVWKVANNCLRQCLLSPFFSLGPFSLSPHGYLYLRHLAVIDPDVPTRLRKEILAPLSLIHANPLHIGGNVFLFVFIWTWHGLRKSYKYWRHETRFEL